MISYRVEGALGVVEKLELLKLSKRDRRRLNLWVANALQRAMRRAVREKVEHSPLELFASSDRVRRRKARSFARMVGSKADADKAVLFDRGFGHNLPSSGNRATDEQAARMREMGFKMSVRRIRQRFTRNLAGLVIRRMEAAQARGREHFARRRERRRGRLTAGHGSLLMLVWREGKETILAEVDVLRIVRGYFKARLAI